MCEDFDTVIMAICPYCHKYMDICPESKTYCQNCDFSYNGKDPCKGCQHDIPGHYRCRVGGFKKINMEELL